MNPGLPFTFALQIIDRMRRFSVNAFALHTFCWTKFALPVHDLAPHDNDRVEAHLERKGGEEDQEGELR